MSQTILILVEGEKREEDIINSLKNARLFPKPNRRIVYAGEIYQLYKKLEGDDGLDLIGLLQEQGELAVRRPCFI
ncbi:hypothetical protein BMT54_08035 [Pasteurellaceae bacterium 15-036681]|nr:hypothetical protein BMT54_08035 [Pasteurellaceae bacterium 15-036681]